MDFLVAKDFIVVQGVDALKIEQRIAHLPQLLGALSCQQQLVYLFELQATQFLLLNGRLLKAQGAAPGVAPASHRQSVLLLR